MEDSERAFFIHAIEASDRRYEKLLDFLFHLVTKLTGPNPSPPTIIGGQLPPGAFPLPAISPDDIQKIMKYLTDKDDEKLK